MYAKMNELPGWEWQPDKCRVDEDFIEWLHYDGSGRIFHMGTGLHHKVGDWCSANLVDCYGITASQEEFRAASGHITPYYQVILADIYKLHKTMLPEFNIMSLFHLGELVDLFGEIDEVSVWGLMSKVVTDGKILFYRHSSAFDRVEPFIKSTMAMGYIKPYAVSENLEIYSKL